MKMNYIKPEIKAIKCIETEEMIAVSIANGGTGNDGDIAETKEQAPATSSNNVWDKEW